MILLFETKTPREGNAMNNLIARFQEQGQLNGVLSGFDRLVFRGTLGLSYEAGLKGYLWANHLGLKDFGAHAEQVSKKVKEASLAVMQNVGRPIRYLNSGKDDKQALARSIAVADGIQCGPICALTAVELCSSYAIRGDHDSQKIRLERAYRKCLFIYQYWMHPVFGFMSARLQTWFPFSFHIYLNGRIWLARQMEEAGIQYRRHDNCFTWIEDFARAQQMMDTQLTSNWASLLGGVAQQVHPFLEDLCRQYPMKYYWTCQDSEWATDIVFRDRQQLQRLYPQLVHLGMTSFSSPDVLRFMGKRVTRQGTAFGPHEVPISTDLKVRPNGVRIKHRLGANSIKLYDKAYDELGAVLRPEITITDTHLFRVYRPKNGEPDSPPQWRVMRRGLEDLHRRTEVSQKALDCYCDALAAVDDSTTLQELTSRIERRVRWNGKPVRALHPFDPDDHSLLRAVNRGEFAINGLRNRDLQQLLYDRPAKTAGEKRRRSAAVSRKLRMLRAHGLIHKLPHTHRYRVSEQGRLILNAILSAHRMTTQQLTAAA
jgi:hypothetical protein